MHQTSMFVCFSLFLPIFCAGAIQLTRLDVEGDSIVMDSGPTVLSTKTRLQHLSFKYCSIVTGSAGMEPLMIESAAAVSLCEFTFFSLFLQVQSS